MTVKYNYQCSSCGHVYVEQRAAEEQQIFTTCHACSAGVYEEVSVNIISEVVEREAGEDLVEEPLND